MITTFETQKRGPFSEVSRLYVPDHADTRVYTGKHACSRVSRVLTHGHPECSPIRGMGTRYGRGCLEEALRRVSSDQTNRPHGAHSHLSAAGDHNLCGTSTSAGCRPGGLKRRRPDEARRRVRFKQMQPATADHPELSVAFDVDRDPSMSIVIGIAAAHRKTCHEMSVQTAPLVMVSDYGCHRPTLYSTR
jgi:hypothetical protein